jgi:hypothetical protein
VPYNIVLDQVPHGIAAANSTGVEGTLIPVAIREFSSSGEGEPFLARLDSLTKPILAKLPVRVLPSTIDHLVAILRVDNTATVYINECNVFIRARPQQDMQAGQVLYDDAIVDVNSLVFQGVTFPKDAAIIVVFSAGWRKGLFFDLGPVGPDRRERDYEVEPLLGSYMAYLYSQTVFSVSDADWDYLIGDRWFPFISLTPALKEKFIAFAKDRTDLNRLLPEVSAHVRGHLGEMVQRWESSQLFAPHISFLKRAAERFEQGDFVSCVAIVYPRIEGLMRTLFIDLQVQNRASQQRLSPTVTSARAAEFHRFTLLLPEAFKKYLTNNYFADFVPGQQASLSRNSVGHGVATFEQFDEKAAVIGLLTLDQIFYFVPPPPDTNLLPDTPPTDAPTATT